MSYKRKGTIATRMAKVITAAGMLTMSSRTLMKK